NSTNDFTALNMTSPGGGNFFSKATGNLDDVNTWGANADGTGTSPSNFTDAGQVFYIRNNATRTLGANWTVSGTDAKAILGDGAAACNFTVPASFSFTGTIDINNNGTLTLQNA